MIAWLSLGVALMQSPERPAALDRFLRQSIALDTAQLAAMERGEAVVKVLDTRDRRDVALFGIVTADMTREAYVRRARDFQNSLRTATRARFGIFSTPAVAADVEAVTIPERDVKDMRDCKPGDCVVKLPATDMQGAHQAVNWSAPFADVQAQINAYARRRLVEYITDYRARGDSAMAVYDDRGTLNVHSSEAFAALLAESPYVFEHVPSLTRYLASYPRATLADATEIMFWSEDVMPRLRPILSVTHLVVYTPRETPTMAVVAAKQIYADHYFESALDLTGAVDRRGGGGGLYLLVLRRYRFDNMPSGGILNIRGRAVGALRDQLLGDLRRQKTTGPGN